MNCSIIYYRYSFLRFKASSFQGFQVSSFPRCQVSKIPKLQDSNISEFTHTKTYKIVRITMFPRFKVSKLLGTQKANTSNIFVHTHTPSKQFKILGSHIANNNIFENVFMCFLVFFKLLLHKSNENPNMFKNATN